MPLIDLLITACLLASTDCTDIRAQTQFTSVQQCQGSLSQQALAEIMAAYPKRHVVRYVCEEVKVGRDA